MSISIFSAISDAIAWTTYVLFEQFSASRWFVFAFGAFLAALGQGGAPVTNLNFSSRHHSLSASKQFIAEHLPLIIIGVALLIVIGCVIAILFTWLSSRGTFIFLDSVVRNHPEIARPWRDYAARANTLFIFRLVFGVICFVFIIALIGIMLLGLIPMLKAETATTAGIGIMVFGSLGLLFVIIVISLVRSLVSDFIVPIMYLRNVFVIKAFSIFSRELLAGHPGDFVLFYLMKILLSFAIGCASLLIVALTCCMCCTLLFPFLNLYVASLVFLPFIMFMRCYSLFFLQQFGDDWLWIDRRRQNGFPDLFVSAEVGPETV